MALETDFSNISKLNPAWPTANDLLKTGDDHIRGVKEAVTKTFPNISGIVNYTQDELNLLKTNISNSSSLVTIKQPVDVQNKNISNVATPVSGTSGDTQAVPRKYVTDNFVGKDASGNVTVGGTTTVTGTLTASNGIVLPNAKNIAGQNVTASATRNIGKVTASERVELGDATVVTDIQGSAIHLKAPADVAGAFTVDGLLTVSNGASITGTVTSEHYRSTGNCQFDGDVGMSSDLSIAKVLRAAGPNFLVEQSGKTTANGGFSTGAACSFGPSTITGNATVSGTATLNGTTNTKDIHVTGVQTVSNYTTAGGFSALNHTSPMATQGAHFVWNENNDGAGSIVVNKGGGSGGFRFRFVNSNNSVQDGGIEMNGTGRLGCSTGFSTKAGANGQINHGHVFNIELGGDGGHYLWIDQSAYRLTDTPTSDKELKEDITYVDGSKALGEVTQWKPAVFSYKARGIDAKGKPQLGFIANDLVKVSPETVKGKGLEEGVDINDSLATRDAYYLDPVALIAKLTMAVQELSAKVAVLEANK